MPEQLTLDLPVRPALGREDFLVTPSNALALALIDGWRTWPAGKLALVGPPGAGKTHLAHVWAAESGARLIAAQDVTEDAVPDLASAPVCVEDVPRIAGQGEAEAALFHLHNLALAQGQPLMLTGTGAPRDWPLALPDLASRVQATPVAELAPPDDTLLGAVLVKLFADRQLVPGASVVPYLVRHMPRSFAMAHELVAEMDRRALSRKGTKLKVPLAAEVLHSLAGPDAED